MKITTITKNLKEFGRMLQEQASSTIIPSSTHTMVDEPEKDDKYVEIIEELNSNVNKIKNQFNVLRKEFNQVSLANELKIQNKADEESVQELECYFIRFRVLILT